jgi:uncharacterized membrane protein
MPKELTEPILLFIAGFICGCMFRVIYVSYKLRQSGKVFATTNSPFNIMRSCVTFLMIFIFAIMVVSEIINPQYHINNLFFPIIGIVFGALYTKDRDSKVILKGLKSVIQTVANKPTITGKNETDN